MDQFNINSYNLASPNKWIMSIPYKVFDKETMQSDITLNLYKFNPPDFSTGYLPFYIQGIEFPIPNNIRNEDKTITAQYLPSSDFSQLKFLYTWFNLISDEFGVAVGKNVLEFSGPVSVTLISEYKTPIFSITYHDAWLIGLDKLDLDYQTGGDTLTHGFTLKYSHYTVDGLIEKDEDC